MTNKYANITPEQFAMLKYDKEQRLLNIIKLWLIKWVFIICIVVFAIHLSYRWYILRYRQEEVKQQEQQQQQQQQQLHSSHPSLYKNISYL